MLLWIICVGAVLSMGAMLKWLPSWVQLVFWSIWVLFWIAALSWMVFPDLYR